MINNRLKAHKKILIKENHEPMVPVNCFTKDIFIKPKKNRIPKNIFYVRKTVAKMLAKATTFLPHGYFLIIRDAYRSIESQSWEYQKTYKKLKKTYPQLSKQKIIEKLNVLVYPPALEAPPHPTGGAVDVNLTRDLKTGRRIPLRTKKLPAYEQNRVFEKKLPKHIKSNRKILFDAMIKAGFVNYPEEWWHYSYGEKDWALQNNKQSCFYGRVKNFFI